MSSRYTVLIIDDDSAHRRLLQEVLSGADCAVSIAEDGASGLRAFAEHPFKLLVLDLGLPDTDGLAICRAIRDLPGGRETFILLLTGRRELADRVAGFHAGADDYLMKPVDVYELCLRVKAIRRRQHDADLPETADAVVGEWRLDANTRTLQRPQGSVALTPAEFQLLAHLMRHPAVLCSAAALLQHVWHYPAGTGSPDLVRFHIRRLRKKLEIDPEQPQYLVSVPHHGYMLRVPGTFSGHPHG